MKIIGLWMIRAYQLCISPLLPPVCKYRPTCSCYTYEAIARHGLVAGVAMGSKRLCRCNPWSLGGADPVPEVIRWSWRGPVRVGPAPQYDFGRCACDAPVAAAAAAGTQALPAGSPARNIAPPVAGLTPVESKTLQRTAP